MEGRDRQSLSVRQSTTLCLVLHEALVTRGRGAEALSLLFWLRVEILESKTHVPENVATKIWSNMIFGWPNVYIIGGLGVCLIDSGH